MSLVKGNREYQFILNSLKLGLLNKFTTTRKQLNTYIDEWITNVDPSNTDVADKVVEPLTELEAARENAMNAGVDVCVLSHALAQIAKSIVELEENASKAKGMIRDIERQNKRYRAPLSTSVDKIQLEVRKSRLDRWKQQIVKDELALKMFQNIYQEKVNALQECDNEYKRQKSKINSLEMASIRRQQNVKVEKNMYFKGGYNVKIEDSEKTKVYEDAKRYLFKHFGVNRDDFDDIIELPSSEWKKEFLKVTAMGKEYKYLYEKIQSDIEDVLLVFKNEDQVSTPASMDVDFVSTMSNAVILMGREQFMDSFIPKFFAQIFQGKTKAEGSIYINRLQTKILLKSYKEMGNQFARIFKTLGFEGSTEAARRVSKLILEIHFSVFGQANVSLTFVKALSLKLSL